MNEETIRAYENKGMLVNGTLWRDTDGNPIHAHGGHMLEYNGVIYWYGEDRRERNYVSCYASTDMMHWEFRGHVLTMDSPVLADRVRADLSLQREDGGRVNIERPKVLYNALTKKFVMWMHYENGVDYHCAAAAVATCDTPDGEFTYHGSFRPLGCMSRDCTLYAEEDGRAYFLSASRDNYDMHAYLLQEDYLNVEKQVGTFWSNESREAPALLRVGEKIVFVSSFCTGWAPNQCKYAVSESIEQGFGLLRLTGNATTYLSQAAFLLRAKNAQGGDVLLYMGDRWGGKGEKYFESSYTLYELRFTENGSLTMIPYTAFRFADGKFEGVLSDEDAAAYAAAQPKEGCIE